MGLVDNKDITVVVQGAVDREKTPICLQSIRRMLPGAFIILSTWEGTDVDGLEYDDVVLSEDPGGFDEFNIPFSPKNNINRQIVSTYQGLLKVKTVYALKLRTDFYLCDDGFKDFFNTYSDTKQLPITSFIFSSVIKPGLKITGILLITLTTVDSSPIFDSPPSIM